MSNKVRSNEREISVKSTTDTGGDWRGRVVEYNKLLNKRGIFINCPQPFRYIYTGLRGNKISCPQPVQLTYYGVLSAIEEYSILPYCSRSTNKIDTNILPYLLFSETITNNADKLQALLNVLEELNKIDPDMKDSWWSLWPSLLVMTGLSALVVYKIYANNFNENSRDTACLL